MGGNEEEGARLFSVLPIDGTRGNGHKLKHRIFHENTRKHFFYCECGQTLEQVAQRCCGFSLLGGTQNPTGHSPGQPVLADCLSRRVGLDSNFLQKTENINVLY